MKDPNRRKRLWFHQKLEFGISKKEAKQFLQKESKRINKNAWEKVHEYQNI